MTPFAFSHNPDDLVDWLWVVLAFGFVIAVGAIVVAVLVRWFRERRRRDRHTVEGGGRR